MRITDGINQRIVDVALNILNEQSVVPQSPAIYDEQGKLCLCAAGILAKAGLMVVRPLEANDAYWSDTVLTQDKSRLFEIFGLLGWDSMQCRNLIAENDAADPADRRMTVAKRMAGLGCREGLGPD